MNENEVTGMDQSLINRIVEAALLAANQPLTIAQLQNLFSLDAQAPDGSIAEALNQLQQEYQQRGIELVEVASGWRFQIQSDVHSWVARLWTERQTKYTRATLETLALVAYRQPITRGEIEQVRGVATSSNIIKALEEREWIRVVGHRDMPGKPELLGTTKGFLDYFGLKSLDELPPLSELKDFSELDPQLKLEDDAATQSNDTLPVGDLSVTTTEQNQQTTNSDTDDTSEQDDDVQDLDDLDAELDTFSPQPSETDQDTLAETQETEADDEEHNDLDTTALADEGDSTWSKQ